MRFAALNTSYNLQSMKIETYHCIVPSPPFPLMGKGWDRGAPNDQLAGILRPGLAMQYFSLL
jgi:hypothetical protein